MTFQTIGVKCNYCDDKKWIGRVPCVRCNRPAFLFRDTLRERVTINKMNEQKECKNGIRCKS